MGHELHALHQARARASVVAVGIHGEHTPRLRRGQRLEPGPRQQVILHRSQMTVYTGVNAILDELAHNDTLVESGESRRNGTRWYREEE
jgi:hypothetical protein